MKIDTNNINRHIMFWLLLAFLAGFGFAEVATRANINPLSSSAAPPVPNGGGGCQNLPPTSPLYCGTIGGGGSGGGGTGTGGGTGYTGSPASFDGDIDVPPAPGRGY